MHHTALKVPEWSSTLVSILLLLAIASAAAKLLLIAANWATAHIPAAFDRRAASARKETTNLLFSVVGVLAITPWIAASTNFATDLFHARLPVDALFILVLTSLAIGLVGLVGVTYATTARSSVPRSFSNLYADLRVDIDDDALTPARQQRFERILQSIKSFEEARVRRRYVRIDDLVDIGKITKTHLSSSTQPSADATRKIITLELARRSLPSTKWWPSWLSSCLVATLGLIPIEVGTFISLGWSSDAAVQAFASAVTIAVFVLPFYFIDLVTFRSQLRFEFQVRLQNLIDKALAESALAESALKASTRNVPGAAPPSTSKGAFGKVFIFFKEKMGTPTRPRNKTAGRTEAAVVTDRGTSRSQVLGSGD